ncbi:MAG: 30S ribosomal protein S12 methylthiotransferase RimO, partial [Thermovirga sp.]|nr:30S ribosomal protein S12 methylthiotransferase RimO [Thermovirga sp.]
MTEKKVFILSLGCAKNQVDSETLAGLLKGAGFSLVEKMEDAQIAIVNTCGFIQPAVEESIDAILDLEELKRAYSLEKIGVVGCLLNRYGEELKKELPMVDFWAEAGQWEALLADMGSSAEEAFQEVLPGHSVWSRYLKISEGCSNNCSYCMIPSIRGPLRSFAVNEILSRAEFLVEQGAREICLVGQDLTAYGMDWDGKSHLLRLIEVLNDKFSGSKIWFRLLYLHPARVDRDIISAVVSSDVFLNYLDMPLQHVDPEILAKMNRGAFSEKDLRMPFEVARELDPDFTLRTTFMAGFPGETEKHHSKVLDFIEEIQLDRVGVFTFYEEEGTKAALMPEQVPVSVRERRASEILELQSEISYRRQQRFVGKTL